ncbi:4761_t:CDS:2 [Acaulospora morrowiae]|uniref:Transmembrane protein 198 n=1 Tax=Acaulospora morrowiae TaxID=94023 RepID=A0A9N8Z7A7_9GLOM|nr:4761_t:CDS:2 [Acaulospora morrowiae]
MIHKVKNSFAQGTNDALLRILICLITFFSSSISADDDSTSQKLSSHAIIIGIILIITGIIYCFFGRRIYHLTLFLLGLYIGSILGWIILTNNEPASGYAGDNSDTVILIASLAIGFLVGLTFICLSTLAIHLLGALAGYSFAMFILSWSSNGIIQSKAGQIVLIVTFTVIGVILIHFFRDDVIIFGTAFIGSYAIILGVDMFAQTGFSDSVRTFLDGNHKVIYHATTKVYLMLVGMIGLFIVGGAYQHFRNRHAEFHPRKEHRNIPAQEEKKKPQV